MVFRVFLLALRDVLKARGDNMSALSKQTHLNRQNLYRMLSDKGNPQWDGLNSLFNALGLQVQLSFKDQD